MKFLILSTLLVGLAFGQEGDDLEGLIGSVFPGPGGQQGGQQGGQGGQTGPNLNPGGGAGTGGLPGTGKCECVPYYLCANNTIIKDGVGLIDIRYNN